MWSRLLNVLYDMEQFFLHISISLRNHSCSSFLLIIWFLNLSLKKNMNEWQGMTQFVIVIFVNNIWPTTIFECLTWTIWMEMWTMSKTTYSSSLQLHPSSRITYSFHHICDVETSPNSPIEFWVYDFWSNLSRAR